MRKQQEIYAQRIKSLTDHDSQDGEDGELWEWAGMEIALHYDGAVVNEVSWAWYVIAPGGVRGDREWGGQELGMGLAPNRNRAIDCALRCARRAWVSELDMQGREAEALEVQR